ncbi:thiamine-binding protein [Buchananella felis]|uniref:thiamine-binding protein n=1 Tax=Buchananella felis TaxID=3231492 RepID=UPI003529B9F0
MLLAFSVAPLAGVDDTGSVSAAVARAVAVVRASGLPHETTAMFTTLEGEWDEVMAVVKQATDAVLEVAPRASLVIKADVRPGFTGELQGKLDRLEAALADAPGGERAGEAGGNVGHLDAAEGRR